MTLQVSLTRVVLWTNNKIIPTVDPSLVKKKSMAKTSKYYKKNPKAAARRRKQQRKYNKTKKGLRLESMQTNLIENLVHMETVTVWMPPIIRVARPVAITNHQK